jgi:hypothetical protein
MKKKGDEPQYQASYDYHKQDIDNVATDDFQKASHNVCQIVPYFPTVIIPDVRRLVS